MDGNKPKYLRYLYFILAIILIVAVFVIFKKYTATVPTQKLVSCTATPDTPVASVPGWNTFLFPAPRLRPMPHEDQSTSLQPSYSLTKLKNNTETGDIYYRVEMRPRADLPRDTRKIIEVCDENNQVVQFGSTADTKMSGASANVQSSISNLPTYFISGKSTNYRIDAFLFTAGKWTLTNRIDSVKIVN